MLKPPITLSIAPSRGQAVCHGCLFFAGLGLVAWQLTGWLGLLLSWLAGMILLGMLSSQWRLLCANHHALKSKTLQVESAADALQGRWLLHNGELSHSHRLGCHYLGPFLICLDVGGKKIWLWPDSAPAQAQRELRRYLLLHRF